VFYFFNNKIDYKVITTFKVCRKMDENFDSTMALLATEIPNVPLLNTTFSLVDEKNSFIVQGSMEAKPRFVF